VDPSLPGAKPFEGWPIETEQLENGLWGAKWELDPVETPEFREAVVQVRDEASDETVYTIRITSTSFKPKVRNPGTYTVVAFDPDGDFRKVYRGVKAKRIESV